MSDECLELKNIKYQTMLLNNNSKTIYTEPNVTNIEHFLQKEKELNKTKPWNKLGKASKLKRINEYVDEYSVKNNIKSDNIKKLKQYLLYCLDRKRLQRQKDIVYDVKTNKIKDIPGLFFNKSKNKFTLKRQDKKTSTLKCLAPKKHKKEKKAKGEKKAKTEKKIKNEKKAKKIKNDKKKTKKYLKVKNKKDASIKIDTV